MPGKPHFAQRPLPPDTRAKSVPYMRAAGSHVPALTAKAFARFGFHSAEIMTDWARVAGAELAAITAPERIKWPRNSSVEPSGEAGQAAAAVLVLRVEPARALDVEYRRAEIIDRVNRFFGYRAIASLTIVQAPLLAPPTLPRASRALPAIVAPGEAADALTAALAELEARVASERQNRTLPR